MRCWWYSGPLLAMAVGALTACGGSPGPSSAGPGHVAVATAVASPEPYQLYTHCGIYEARIGNRYFEAVHPLSDGNGNPPPGWGNPYQDGTMMMVSPSEAVFRDAAGHRVLFRVRAGAAKFMHVCS